MINHTDLDEELEARKITPPTCYSCIPVGWKVLFLGAIDEAIQRGWNKQGLGQFKEKFGTLRIYIDDVSDEIDKIFTRAEYLSRHTCADCGKIDLDGQDVKLTKLTGWMLTLCQKCLKLQATEK